MTVLTRAQVEPPTEPSSVTGLNATRLAAGIATGALSSRDAVEHYLARIAELNPVLNAVVTLDADGARRAADEADNAIRRGEPHGALHGVPITVKDTISTAGLRTTSGSRRLERHVPKDDATCVARLRAAGGIVLGKTNTPEFATGAETSNALFGRTVNPADHARTPGGSSGGSAAAIAARLSPLDIGSDIGGSIRHPAHFCGVYGLKPTDHLVSPVGHIPPPPGSPWGLLRALLSVGPLAGSIDDLELALTVIAGPDLARPDVPPIHLEPAAEPTLAGLRIAWWDDFGVGLTGDTRRTIEGAVSALRACGATVELRCPADFDAARLASLACEMEFATTRASRPPMRVPRVVFRQAARVVERSDRAAAGFVRGMGATLGSLARTMSARDRAIADLETFLGSWDAWLTPVASMPAFPHFAKGGILDQLRARVDVDGRQEPLVMALAAFTSPFNLTGSPALVVPAGRSPDGLPIGLQLVGRRWEDMRLLSVGRALSRVS